MNILELKIFADHYTSAQGYNSIIECVFKNNLEGEMSLNDYYDVVDQIYSMPELDRRAGSSIIHQMSRLFPQHSYELARDCNFKDYIKNLNLNSTIKEVYDTLKEKYE